MKKFKFGDIKVKKATPEQLTDRLLLVNLYFTQAITLIIGLVWILFQKRNPFHILNFPEGARFVAWGLGLAVIMLIVDFVLTYIVPEETMDDGGINELLFRGRPIWHIALIAAIVSVCEELLFRGAVQYAFGPYWTSILFAIIHVRYLRHWIPTGWVFASSYGLGLIYIYSGTIWAPILCHFIIDLFSGLVIRYRRES
ncbi:CPBP family intramembrane metalloprotease [Paenibacillus sp. 7124]|uniref:CPBP family intramembrane metalloprotease n=1 Tax=Paenibacillus apii TaxID=1850370 RepID=A0A6M1PG74_9BACL|nr:type II CAAX endopeptidase family protein [Paenibacillus apii]NGM81514.1 CPBP family intramembrane metalloprotease [Paenibacillus apii]NJJ38099.1 CPBP family intramembrane metalloprotease [Paenibacillus apii]